MRTRLFLTVRGLSKAFRGLKAVQDVSFDVPARVVYGIVGQNGAGKTSLFNLINGFIRADHGALCTLGFHLPGCVRTRSAVWASAAPFRSRVHFRASQRSKTRWRVPFRPSRMIVSWSSRAAEALAFFGLSHRADALPSESNNLESALLELARALAGRRKSCCWMKPSQGSRPRRSTSSWMLSSGCPGRGVTVMIIEHTMHAMMQICDEMLVLDHGSRDRRPARPAGVTRQPQVVEAYLGEQMDARP